MPIGFNFNFYGTEYNQFRISPNGWIGFGDDWPHYTNYGLPREDAPKPAIFGFWDDLHPLDQSGGGGTVYYYTNNSDSLVVCFDEVKHWTSPQFPFDLEITFEIILKNDEESTNDTIIFQYQSFDGDIDSATIGIQNELGNIGLQVAYNEDFVENEFAIEFSTEAYPRPLDIAEDIIMDDDNDAVIVLGHDRDRGQSSLYAAGQHPYRFEWNDKIYTFQHNGNQYAKQEMIDYLEIRNFYYIIL